MEQKKSQLSAITRRFLGFFLMVVALCGGPQTRAQIADSFDNTAYYFSGSGSPVINATNFNNEFGGVFDIEFTNTFVQGNGWENSLYRGWYYVRNFKNDGDMICNTGFRFVRQSPANGSTAFIADSFTNTGNIKCGTNGTTLAGALVWATNIFNSGSIEIGNNGLGRFFGKNVDFTRGTVSMTKTVGINSSPIVGTDTNSDWFPSFYLTPTTALSSYPVFLSLNNSKSYFDIQPGATPTNFIVRMIFIENVNSNNVGYNIYFEPTVSALGLGYAHVEWYGAYNNLADGQPATNYLYLTDDYALGATTNVFTVPASGIPINYTLVNSDIKIDLGAPTASSFPITFPSGPVTNNIYSYFSANLVASSVATNSGLTNVAGRVEISATNALNLSLAKISGMNYLQLRATNQFDDDGQSLIYSPYTDMYLGSTNNNLIISNVLASAIPGWSGNVQAWNTRWSASDAVNTYDFRVLLVSSTLVPTNGPIVQDCVLYASNNVTISDTLNIIRSVSLNCTNLVISTNDMTSGATSPRGELLLNNQNLFWASTVPRLRTLTNNGALLTLNLANYGSAAIPYLAFVNTGYITNFNGAFINSYNFEHSGYFSAGNGSFSIRSLTTLMTNGAVLANGVFTNVSGSFVVSNTTIIIGKSMAITATNLLSDYGTTNNFWSLGTGNSGQGDRSGLYMPVKPLAGDLNGTVITNVATAGTKVIEIWSGVDRGQSELGYSNNAAVGQMLFDARGPVAGTQFYFKGVAATNALYVDCLNLTGYATNVDGSYNVKSLVFDTNNHLIIYYAQALANGATVAEKINHKNGDHLRWIPTHLGYFSSTNLVYPAGVTNVFNTALTQSTTIDSDGDGIVNADDSTPFFVPALMNFQFSITNVPVNAFKLNWDTIPGATNIVQYKTNLLSPNWINLTNFISPQPMNSPATNVTVWDPINPAGVKFYRVVVQPLM